MDIIVGGRKTSKTTQLIELCAEAQAKGEVSYIICHSQDNARMISQKAREMGLTIRFPMTYSEFNNRQYAGLNIEHFFFDNVDMYLKSLTPVHIAAITLNTAERTILTHEGYHQ